MRYLAIIIACLPPMLCFGQSGPAGVRTLNENVFWLRADKNVTYDDSNNVTTWSDQSNSNDASNIDTSTNPIIDISAGVGSNLEPAILFTSGTPNEYLDILDNPDINTALLSSRTIYFVFQTGADITSSIQYLYQQGDATNGIEVYISATGILTFGITSASSTEIIESTALSVNTEYIAGFTYDGGNGNLDLIINGTASVQNNAAPASVASHNNIRIGSDNSAANGFDGHIAEIIYYDEVLNAGELRTVENYLAEKYGITIVNDHYNIAGAAYRYSMTGISRVSGDSHNTSIGQGGTMYLSENGADALLDDEHIFSGHDNNNLSSTSSDVTSINSERYNRTWYLQKTGNAGVVIEFDVIESGLYTTMSGLVASDFKLLSRAGTMGDFSEVTTSKSLNGDRVQFTITTANLSNSYFTLGIPGTAKKWYVINSGFWSDPNTWTLDPAGSIYNNPDGLTPDTSPTKATDEVTILSGKTVTVSDDDMAEIPVTFEDLPKLIVNGILDFGNSDGHTRNIAILEGSGIIRLSANELPSITDPSNFISEGTGAGTVEYYGAADVDLNSASQLSEFYNLTLSFGDVSDHLIITTDITINGNLNISSGDFQINDATDGSANIRTITAKGNVTVGSAGAISTGTGDPMSDLSLIANHSVPVNESNYYSAFHQFEIQGNFTNNGTARFHNLDFPSFRTLPTQNQTTLNTLTTGVTTVKFTGYSNNTAALNGETSFYNLLVDKGADNTYTLTINASTNENFYLFGKSGYRIDNVTAANPTESGSSLWIKNGTLELQGSTKIASLIEIMRDDPSIYANAGGDDPRSNKQYVLPQNGKLYINGADVEVYLIAKSGAEVDALWGLTGTLDSEIGVINDTNGARYRSLILSGNLQIDNGLFDFNDAEPLQYMAAAAPIIEVNGGVFSLPMIRSHNSSTGTPTYIQTGGTVHILGNSTGVSHATINGSNITGSAFSFPSNDGVFRMSGGEMIIYDLITNRTAPNGINVAVKEGNYSVTGGTITIDVNGQTNATNPFEINFTPNFYNLNIVDSDGRAVDIQNELIITNDLSIEGATSSSIDLNGNDISIGRNFILESGTTFTQNGDNITNFNGDAAQTITLDGTLTSDFYDVVFSGSGLKTINGSDLTTTYSMTIASGSAVDDGGNTIFIQGTLTNSGTHQSTTGGALEFNGGSDTYLVDGDGNGAFGNVNLNDGTNDVNFNSNQTIYGTLTFSVDDQLLVIGANGLTMGMGGLNSSIMGYDGNNYISTDGNASDEGLSIYVDVDKTVNFPFGSGGKYTPASSVFSGIIDDGFLTISPADAELETTNQSGGNILSYYWRANHSGFDNPPTVQYAFTYDNSDTHTGSQLVTVDNYEAGNVLDESPFTRSAEGAIIDATNQITFSATTIENANYTAGDNVDIGGNQRFFGAPTIYYSRVNNGTWKDWNVNANWSTVSHQGAAASSFPGAGDVAIIGSTYIGGGTGRHQFRGTTGIDISVAELIFNSQTGGTALNVTAMSRLRIRGARTLSVGKCSGTGEIVQDIGTVAQTGIVIGDFGDFISEVDNGWFYWFQSTTDVTISDRFEYPIFRTFGANGTLTFDQPVTSHGIVIDSDTDLRVTVDFYVDSLLQLGSNSSGELVFRDVGSNVTFDVGYIDFSNDANNAISVDNTGSDIHRLVVRNNIDLESGSGFDLTSDAGSQVELEFQGTGDHSFTSTIGTSADLYKIIVNKGSNQTSSFTFNDDFTLLAPTASVQPLEMQNGTLVINNSTIGDANDVILSNSINGNNFNIPSTSTLQISQGTLTLEGTNIGITLDGSIVLDNTGILDMDGGTNNYIEYSSSGSASIAVSGTAQLLVGSQIRQNAVSTGGIINFSQSGGTVMIGQDAVIVPIATNRPMFDVSGVGSSFIYTGGDFIVSNHLTGASIATVLIDPATSTIGTGTNMQFGDGSTASGFQDMTIQSQIDLYDITIDNTSGFNTTLTLLNTGLNIENDINIETGTTFDAAGFDLNIAGDFNNSGTFTSNSNSTTFNGSVLQTITGDGTAFHNLNKTESNTVQLAAGTNNISIANNFTISNGTFDDNDNGVSVQGTVNNTATYTNSTLTTSVGNGLILNGTAKQTISGGGTFSKIEIDNTNDVSLDAGITVTEEVLLTDGNLDIEGFELRMEENAVFSGTFSSSNMVQTRRSFTDAGIVKVYNGTAASPFIYPIGSGDKYTPVTIVLTQNGETDATIAVRAADEPHPNVQEDLDSPEFVDQDNVLQYYWEVTSSGMTDFLGNITFEYFGSDAYVTSPFTLDDYHTARLLPDNSDTWNKLPTGFEYQSRDGSNALTFDITNPAADDEIGGDYTAGIEDAIPDEVQTVTSNLLGGSGDWTDNDSWDTTAPRGAIVDILAGDEIRMDDDGLLAYRTIINGTIVVQATANQRLGRVSGTGTLIVSGSGNLPAGIYDEFFDCTTGGTLAFNDNLNYTLPNEIANIKNLLLLDNVNFTGGIKSFPNTDITICNDLELQDGVTLNNDFNIDVTVLGNLTLTNGTLDLGSNSNYVVNGDVTIDAGSLNLGNNTLTINGNLTVNGGSIAMGSNGSIDLDGDLILSNGNLNGANTSNFNFAGDITKTSTTVAIDATTTTFIADGTGLQTISGDFTGTEAFNNFTVNKASGSVSIIDGGSDVEIDGTLTMTSQNLLTDDTNSLTITSTGLISGGSSSSFIDGPLIKNDIASSANFTFPIGAGARFGYARLINVGTGGQNWTAEYFGDNANSAATIDVTTNTGYGMIVEISTLNSWIITPNGANTANLELGVISGMGVENINDVRVEIFDGPTAGEWVNLGGTQAGTEANGSITTQATIPFVAGNNTFSFGGINNAALPVELVSFTADVTDGGIRLNWVTANEIDNDYFEVERSIDGENFEFVGTVKGNGTTNEVSNYQFIDYSPYIGKSYYRLVQVDFDGNYEIFEAISVINQLTDLPTDFSLYPNPTTSNNINVSLKNFITNERAAIVFYNMSGQIIHREIIEPSSSNETLRIAPSQQLTRGIYHVIITQSNVQITKKIIIN